MDILTRTESTEEVTRFLYGFDVTMLYPFSASFRVEFMHLFESILVVSVDWLPTRVYVPVTRDEQLYDGSKTSTDSVSFSMDYVREGKRVVDVSHGSSISRNGTRSDFRSLGLVESGNKNFRLYTNCTFLRRLDRLLWFLWSLSWRNLKFSSKNGYEVRRYETCTIRIRMSLSILDGQVQFKVLRGE